jgi:hypothetical protein
MRDLANVLLRERWVESALPRSCKSKLFPEGLSGWFVVVGSAPKTDSTFCLNFSASLFCSACCALVLLASRSVSVASTRVVAWPIRSRNLLFIKRLLPRALMLDWRFKFARSHHSLSQSRGTPSAYPGPDNSAPSGLLKLGDIIAACIGFWPAISSRLQPCSSQ